MAHYIQMAEDEPRGVWLVEEAGARRIDVTGVSFPPRPGEEMLSVLDSVTVDYYGLARTDGKTDISASEFVGGVIQQVATPTIAPDRTAQLRASGQVTSGCSGLAGGFLPLATFHMTARSFRAANAPAAAAITVCSR